MLELDSTERKLADLVTRLYTFDMVIKDSVRTSEVKEFSKIREDNYKVTYQVKILITIDGDPEAIYPFEFDIMKLGTNEMKKMNIHIGIVNPVIKLYGGKTVSGASFRGIYINQEKNVCNVFRGKDEQGNPIEAHFALDEINRMIHLNDPKLKTDPKYALFAGFRLEDPVAKNIGLYLDKDYIDPDVTNVDTWEAMLTIACGGTEYGRNLPYTMHDVKIFDFREGMVNHIQSQFWKIRQKLINQLGSRGKVYRTPLLVSIQQYLTGNSARLKIIQTTADTNPLSVRAHSQKVIFMPPEGEDYMRINSRFLDGVVDPTTTAENAQATSKRNELTYACKLDEDNNAHIKAYDKNFNEVYLSYDDYVNARMLVMDCVDYKTRTITPINGKYKYCQRCRYKETDSLDDIDYIRHPESMLSIETCTMSMMNRNNIIRNVIGSHFFTQCIPLENAQPSIIHTQYNKKLYDEDEVSLRSDKSGVVDGISEMKDIIRIKNDDGTISYINCNEGENKQYSETVNHSYNVFDPQVRVGDHVKAGEPVFALNSYKNKEFAICIPLLVAYTTLRGMEIEDGYAISESAAKKFMHKGVKTFEIYLEKDHYRLLDSCKLPKPGDRAEEGDTIMSYIQVTGVEEIIAKMFGSSHKVEEEIKVKLPKYCLHGRIVDVQVMINPQIDKSLVYYQTLKKWQNEVLKSKREFLNNPLYNYEYKEPEDMERENPCDAIIKIDVEFFDPLKITDKLTNRASTKGVVCQIVPDNQMPMTLNGEIIECIMPSLSMCSRKNMYGVLECKLTKLCKKFKTLLETNKVTPEQWKILQFLYREIPKEKLTREYILKNCVVGDFIRIDVEPFDHSITMAMVDEFLECVGIPNGGKEYLIDQVTHKRIRNPVLVGYNEVMRFHFLAQKKGSANPKTTYTENVVMGMGKHKIEGQKWGKQEVETLLGHGLEEFVVQVTNKIGNKRDAEIKSEFTNLLLRLS